MLRRELIIAYLVAGVLAVAVPPSVYQSIVFSEHGLRTDLENVIIGPFIAFISFVRSIGNISLAAALFTGSRSFGGTVSVVFAELITLPPHFGHKSQSGQRSRERSSRQFSSGENLSWKSKNVAG